MLWPANWSQAIPDLINALITGGVIALVFWRLEVHREKKSAKIRALDGWQRLQGVLRPHFSGLLVRLQSGQPWATPARDLRTALEDYPIEEWSRAAKKFAPLSALVIVEREWPRLTDLESAVRGQVGGAVKATTPVETSGTTPSKTASPLMSQSDAQSWMTMLVNAAIGVPEMNAFGAEQGFRAIRVSAQQVNAWRTAASTHPPLVRALTEYDAQFEIVSAAYTVVRAALLESITRRG